MGKYAHVGPEVLAASLVLVPLFLFLHQKWWKNPGRTAAYLLFALYLSGVYAAAGLPGFQELTYRPRINLEFFAYMFSDYRSSLLNVVFFLPLGFFLPMLWRRFRWIHRTVFFGLCTSALIELTQLLTPRATDVNDLVTNTVGTLAGYLLAMAVQLLFPSRIPKNDSRDVYRICAIVAAVMFFVHPLIMLMIH